MTVASTSAPAAAPQAVGAPAVIRRLLRNGKAVFGLLFLTIVFVIAVFAPLLAPYGPMEMGDSFQGPMPGIPSAPTTWARTFSATSSTARAPR